MKHICDNCGAVPVFVVETLFSPDIQPHSPTPMMLAITKTEERAVRFVVTDYAGRNPGQLFDESKPKDGETRAWVDSLQRVWVRPYYVLE